jgi:hypothetical protein
MFVLCTRRLATGGALRHEPADSGLLLRGRLPPPRAKIVPWGLQWSPTGWGTTGSGVRFGSRLVVCLCGHGLVQGLERVENGMRVRRLFHRRGLGVVSVGDLGQIAAQFFEQGDEFGGLLLGQQAHLQVQLGPLFRHRSRTRGLRINISDLSRAV